MKREELERLTKPELIELLLGLQRPGKSNRPIVTADYGS
jgi:hypothetical protein